MSDLQPTSTLTDAFVRYLDACKIEDVRAMSYYWQECQRHHAGWQDEHERRQREIERARQMEEHDETHV